MIFLLRITIGGGENSDFLGVVSTVQTLEWTKIDLTSAHDISATVGMDDPLLLVYRLICEFFAF